MDSKQQIVYTPQVMRSFKPARVFRDKLEDNKSVNSITFDDSGDTCVTAGDDDAFHLWSCKTGKFIKTFYSKKYGIDHVRFTHSKQTLLHTSTRTDHAIRHHSLHNNKYLNYFKGHTELVTSLSVSPTDDTFISASLDETVRLWDTRSQNATGRVTVGHAPVVAHDNQGIIFAVARNGKGEGENAIYFYDLNSFQNGPFDKFEIRDDVALGALSMPPRVPLITSLAFRPNGKHLLVSTSGDVHYVIDAFKGALLRRLVGHKGLEWRSDSSGRQSRDVEPSRGGSGEETCWTQDGKFVLGGSQTGALVVWDLTSLPETEVTPPADGRPPHVEDTHPCAELPGHAGPTRAVASNPRNAMLVTGAEELAFWLPSNDSSSSTGAGGVGAGAAVTGHLNFANTRVD